MSADYHKYALCLKESSIIIFNSRKYSDFTYYVQPDYEEYTQLILFMK